MEVLKRKEFLEKNILPKLGWIDIKYTNHALDRFNERKGGQFYVLPYLLNLEEKMISMIYLEDDAIKKYKVRLHYNSKEWLYLIIVDGNVVKTLWWEDKKKKYEYGSNISFNSNFNTLSSATI